MQSEISGGGQRLVDMLLGGDGAPAFTDDFVDHDPAAGQPAGPAGLAWYWNRFGESFSEVERDVLQVIATDGTLVTVMDLTGTHTGEFMGHAATGKRFTVRNVQVARFRDGALSERWGSTDEAGILQQLGLI